MWRSGIEPTGIAKVLKVHKSTIGREVQRHQRRDGRYDADSAEHKAQIRRSNSKYQGMKIEKHQELKRFIIGELMKKRSPDEIAGRMRKERVCPRVGKDAIYKWLYSSYGASYTKLLCTKRRKTRKQRKKTKREMIPNRISLDQRPKRGTHAEGDTFVSPRGSTAAVAIMGLKKEKYLEARKIPGMRPVYMKEVVQEISKEIKIDDIAWDNGIENRLHEEFGVSSYFCDPHAPWQKPFIEGSIGLIRRWFIPKGTDLNTVSEEMLEEYIRTLNNKYRKSLGYRSAMEVALKRGILKGH